MNVPELRFPEFSGEWEEKKLGHNCKFFSGGTPSTSKREYYIGNIPFIKSGEINNYSTEQMISEEGLDNSSTKLIKKGDLLFALYGATSGEVAISKIDGAINQAVLKIDTKANNHFLYNYFLKDKDKITSTYLQGGQGNLSAKIVKSLSLSFPSLPEQDKIASFLSKVDEKIGFLEKKRQFWKTYKKGIMQKIFSQELRFKDENGEDYPVWEEKNLSEVSDIKTGNKDLKDKIFDGKYPFFVRSDNIERINSYSYDGEAILIPGDGRIGEVYHYINGKFDYHQRVYKISDFGENSGRYIYYYLKKNFYRQAIKNSVKATVDSLRLPTIKKMPIQLPNLSEQIKIANFLLYVDFKIEKIDKEIETNKVFKNGLMQQMFC